MYLSCERRAGVQIASSAHVFNNILNNLYIMRVEGKVSDLLREHVKSHVKIVQVNVSNKEKMTFSQSLRNTSQILSYGKPV